MSPIRTSLIIDMNAFTWGLIVGIPLGALIPIGLGHLASWVHDRKRKKREGFSLGKELRNEPPPTLISLDDD